MAKSGTRAWPTGATARAWLCTWASPALARGRSTESPRPAPLSCASDYEPRCEHAGFLTTGLSQFLSEGLLVVLQGVEWLLPPALDSFDGLPKDRQNTAQALRVARL